MSVTLESASQKEYDFIIVGGKEFKPIVLDWHITGTDHLLADHPSSAGAGAGVAARLAENPNFSVLLVEAGKKYVSCYLCARCESAACPSDNSICVICSL